jgi:hypothetical protein
MVEQVTDRLRLQIPRDGKADRQASAGFAATACKAHALANRRETAHRLPVAE